MLKKAYLISAIFLALLICVSIPGSADEDDSSEPIYENDYHYERTIPIINDLEGSFSLDASIEIYEEPQDNDNSEGLDYGLEVDWDEPLYYKGSTKTLWLTYNGYGVNIEKDGPDAGLNGDTTLEINGRYVNAEVETEFSTGLIPV